jgi:hypothetical protein
MESSEYAPGNCFVTGSAQGPFIDTGVYIPKERFGQLVLSKAFIAEAARLLGLFDDTEEKIDKAYDVGFAEGVKEDLSGSLDRAVTDLGLVVDVLRDMRDAAVAAAPIAEAASGTAPAEVDTGESKPQRTRRAPRQVARAAVDEGPAGVSAGAGDDGPFRV